MGRKINDSKLNELAQVYNEKGKKELYQLLRNQYGITHPYNVLQRMQSRQDLAYDVKQDRFLNQPGSTGPENVFMSMEELCAPQVLAQETVAAQQETAVTRSEALEKLIRELMGDRLLALSKYVFLDTMSKTIILDKTSLEVDGYQLVTH